MWWIFSRLDSIPPLSSDRYAAAMERMIEQVNSELGGRADVMELIGRNPVQMMELNHLHHAQFMLTVFRLHAFDLLVRTVPWVYRAYRSRGFSYDYFPIELRAWKKALADNTAGVEVSQIQAVYDWMINHHQEMIELSVSGDTLGFSLPDESSEMGQIFTALLLHGDHKGCLKLVEQSITSTDELRHFYEHVVKYALYNVGILWERNEISVAEEHLATAIVGRVMSYLYGRFVGTPQTKGTAVVSAAPNEFHEVGARMVADMLELDGWDVTYLGANIPREDLLKIIRQKRPFLLALSVATAFNLENARDAIAAVRNVPKLSDMLILTGGLAFSSVPRLWQEFGADGYAATLAEATGLCNSWWERGTAS
ncbi:MAG: cobalamin-dependent protein [Geobacteraceae bacterium]|nr:cobalamin-dependent protein [Geobacteraceae bacterium]